MIDEIKTQLLTEMRKGIPPKIDACIFDYEQSSDDLTQEYGLRFYEDGLVFCWDRYENEVFESYGYYDPEGKREAKSVGVFEVCNV